MSSVVSQLDCTDNPSLRLEKGTSQLDPHTSLYKRGLLVAVSSRTSIDSMTDIRSFQDLTNADSRDVIVGSNVK